MSTHESVWLATAERQPFPVLDRDIEVDVAVVGGGITGLTTALLLQRDGARVALLEADRVGGGTTGHTTGKVTSQHGLVYDRLVYRHGERTAQQYAEATQWAVDMVATLAEETSADCEFERVPAYVYDVTGDHRAVIETEYQAAVRLGLPATLTDDAGLPFAVALALRFDDQALIHPVRYTTALAGALAAGGAQVFELTRVVDVDERSDHAIVRTARGDVRAGHVVLATLVPTVDLGGFFAMERASRSYGIAARLRTDAPIGMHIDVASPSHSTRAWNDDGRPGLIVVGEGHPTGHREAGPACWDDLERWAHERFDIDAVEYRWSAQDYRTVDELPYVGRSPRMRWTYVATGFRKWGLTDATVAASVLADQVAGRESPWIETFDATRIGDAAAVEQIVEENLRDGRRSGHERVGTEAARSVDHLAAGDGGVVEIDGHLVAAYRHPDGTVDAVSARCTHLGCTVRWNGAERSWDCPCHGSRFAIDGTVLNAPAVQPLERVSERSAR